MLQAGGFGVAVTVSVAQSLHPDPDPEPLPAGVTRRRTRLVELLDPAGMAEAELVGQLATIADARAQPAAFEAGVVASFASRRPADGDLTVDQPGHGVEGWVPDRAPAAGVSEFFADELALVARCSRAAAVGLAERSLVLVQQLPDTWGALADGLIDEPRARAIVKALGGQSIDAGGPVEPAVVAEVEAQALVWAMAGESPVRLAERAAAALIALEEAAADRRRTRDERNADVTVRPLPDGMAELACQLPAPVAVACRETVDSYARMARDDGDSRPIGQLRAQVLADLLLRPWDTSREPVTAHLTVLAPLPALTTAPTDWATTGSATAGPAGSVAGSAAAGPEDAASVNGAPITAGQLRALLAQLDAMGPHGLRAPAGGSLQLDLVDPVTGALRATVTRAELARLVRRGCRDHPAHEDRPGHPAHADRPGHPDLPGEAHHRGARQRSRLDAAAGYPEPAADADLHGGAAAGVCCCAVLDRPPPSHRYRPAPAHYRYVRARDRGWRHPGCRRPAGRTDLDHVCAHATGGATDCSNLCCLCRRHHRLKTHAPGWRFAMTADGVLSVTTPSGVTRATRPPGLRLTDDLLVASRPPAPEDDPPPS